MKALNLISFLTSILLVQGLYCQYNLTSDADKILLSSYPLLTGCNYKYDKTWLISPDSVQDKNIVATIYCDMIAGDDTFFFYKGNSVGNNLINTITYGKYPRYVSVKGSEMLIRFKSTNQLCSRDWSISYTAFRNPSLSISSSYTIMPNTSNIYFNLGIYCNTIWSAKTDVSWISLYPSDTSGSGNDEIFPIITSENTTGANRTGKIFISATDTKSVSVEVTQIYNQDSTYFYIKGLNPIQVVSNTHWNSSCADWINLAPQNDTSQITTIKITPSVNPTVNERFDTIFIIPDKLPKHTVLYRQRGAEPKLEFLRYGEELYLTNDSNSLVQIPISSNCSWSVTSEDTSWLRFNRYSGFLNDTLTIYSKKSNINDTARKTRIILSGPEIKRYKSITQFGKLPSLETSSSSMIINDSPYSIGIYSNTSWTISENCEWLEVSPKNGTGNAVIYFSANSPNHTVNLRSTTVTINYGSSNRKTIYINQAGDLIAAISGSENEVNSSGSGTDTAWIEITSNSFWYAVYKDPLNLHHGQFQPPTYDWLHCFLPQNADSGTMKVGIYADQNPGSSQRNGQVYFCTGFPNNPKVFTLLVKQAGFVPTLILSKDTIIFNCQGTDSTDLIIQSDTKWAIKDSGKWFILNKYKGTGNDTIYISVPQNNTDSLINIDINILYGDTLGFVKNIYVIQEKYLTNMIKEQNELGKYSFNIIPNPNNGVFDIVHNFDASQECEVKIFDSNGILISAFNSIPNSNIIKLNLSSVLSGFYIIQMKQHNFIINKHLIISK